MWQQSEGPLTMGLDLGDSHSHLWVLDRQSDAVWKDRVATSRTRLTKLLEQAPCRRVVMEVGTRSPWVSRLASANTRNLACITHSSRKSDKADAEPLARLGRMDPKLLSPIRRRSEQT
jgi:hypothetical protein